MRIFQNLDYIELEITSTTGRSYFPKDRLYVNRHINRLFAFGYSYNVALTPNGDTTISSNINNYINNININLYDTNSNRVIKSFAANAMQPGEPQDIKIDRVLDWSLCYIDYNNIPAALVGTKVVFVVQYTTHKTLPLIEPTDCRGIVIPSGSSGIISLYDYLGFELDGKPITRISIKSSDTAYISLRDKMGKVYSEIPVALFSQYGNTPANVVGYPEPQYLDCLDLDTQNSYITAPGTLTNDIVITFYFN